RRIARAASAIVSADVTMRPRARTDFSASASRSRSAATRALDSIYRRPIASGAALDAPALRFATAGVDQLGGRPGRQADVRPPFCRAAALQGWTNRAGRDELFESRRLAGAL